MHFGQLRSNASIDKFLEITEQYLLFRQLTPIEQLILRSSLLGHEYSEMARNYTYSVPYLKQKASQLWENLSQASGKRVTKKNLPSLVNMYMHNSDHKLQSSVNTKIITKLQNNYPTCTQTQIKYPGGPIPLDSLLYINRSPIEEITCAEITQPQCLLRIKGSKQMGKTSLLSRIMAHAKAVGYQTVYLDFQEADEAVFASLDKFLYWFCLNITKQLNLNPKLDDYWDEHIGCKVSCKIYFEAYLFKCIHSPIVLGLHELNRVFQHPNIAQDFLPMLRFWHELAQQVETWQKLKLVLVYSTEIYVPLNINQSPFNVGLLMRLPDFTSEQVQELAVKCGLDCIDRPQTELLMSMVGGHPYLVNLAFYYLSAKGMTLEELLLTAPTSTGIYANHLQSLLVILQTQTRLALAIQQVLNTNKSVRLEAITAYQLESMGLIKLDGNLAQIRCKLYDLYFTLHLEDLHNWHTK
ncbi:hypothetical protein NIES4103_26920 [Nostoc sp. NIES-4103]|nr:hypothetical protein NIES4103_26920 [Nostoc sp. NIES-4103]